MIPASNIWRTPNLELKIELFPTLLLINILVVLLRLTQSLLELLLVQFGMGVEEGVTVCVGVVFVDGEVLLEVVLQAKLPDGGALRMVVPEAAVSYGQ